MGIYVISFEMIGYMLWKNNLKLYAKKNKLSGSYNDTKLKFVM